MQQRPGPVWNADLARAIVEPHLHREGALLPMLHALQAVFGCVPREATAFLAETLNLSRAEVHGVVTFYHDFRETPAGARVVRLCRAEACQSRGAEALAADLLRRLGLDWGETTADGELTVEAVYCLGLCSVAPAAMVDGEPLGRLDAPRLAAALDAR
ncbi:MAG: formate dehydrogenase subunit gamma [Phenylobacterium sp.]|nr:formate dehydrogenase subunit gamma [Phenylobacterium sp.]